tara:strand:+ start:398 stop:1375 length:978 start_codon:yes stop_codon:yes gene_type:complete
MQNLEKILIIGFGSIGKKHARIINQFWPKTEISIVSSTLNNSHYRLSYISNKFESIKQGLIWRPDCAIISSPSSFHLEQALILSRANIPILIEKPIGNGKENIKLWEELLSLSKKVPVMIGYVFRHDDCINHFKEFLNSDKLGKLIEVNSYCGSWLPDWRKDFDYKKSVSAREKLGGGVLLELSHEIDFVNYLFGPIDIKYASAGQSSLLKIDVEDNALIYAESKKCSSIIIRLNFCSKPNERYLEAIFSNGKLIWDLIEGSVSFKDDKGLKFMIFKSTFDSDYKYKMQLINFFKFASNKGKTICPLEDGLKVLNLISAAKNIIS